MATDILMPTRAKEKTTVNGSRKKAAVHPQRPGQINLGLLPNLIGYAVRLAQIAVFRDFRRSFAKFKIRPIEYGILTVIELNPGLKQTQVCAALGIKRGNFVPLLNSLERRNLAERRKATDQRANALYLTKAGKLLLQRLQKINEAHERKAASGLTNEEGAQLIRLLNRVREAADSGP